MNNSFACKECIMQKIISDIIQQLPKIPEFEYFDIDLDEEYKKYLEQDPAEINKLIIKSINNNMINLFNFDDSKELDSSEPTLKIEEIKEVEKIEELIGGTSFINSKHKQRKQLFNIIGNFITNTVKFISDLKPIKDIFNSNPIKDALNPDTSPENYIGKDIISSKSPDVFDAIIKSTTHTTITHYVRYIKQVGYATKFIETLKTADIKKIMMIILFTMIIPLSLSSVFFSTSTMSMLVSKDKILSLVPDSAINASYKFIDYWVQYTILNYILMPIYKKYMPAEYINEFIIDSITTQDSRLYEFNVISPYKYSEIPMELAKKYYKENIYWDLSSFIFNFLDKLMNDPEKIFHSIPLDNIIDKICGIHENKFLNYKYEKRIELYKTLQKFTTVIDKFKEKNYPIYKLFCILQQRTFQT